MFSFFPQGMIKVLLAAVALFTLKPHVSVHIRTYIKAPADLNVFA